MLVLIYINLVLNCIQAYDETLEGRWLNCASYVLNKHSNYTADTCLIQVNDQDDLLLNLHILQIRFRQNSLTKQDKDYLWQVKMSLSSKEEPIYYFFVATLL